MKTERELFEIEAREYEDCDLSKNEDGSYKNDLTHTCFYWWCKSVSREGYKLVPVCRHEWSIQLSGRFICDLCGEFMDTKP